MSWINRLLGSFRKNKLGEQLDDELQLHIEMRTQEFIAGGMVPDEARQQAMRLFGNRFLLKEKTREMATIGWIETLLQDTRYAFRMLRKNPGFTVVAVLTLALGIGANTAIFSIVRSIIFRPLPFRDSERLVWIRDDPSVLSVTFQSWRRMNSSFEALAAFNAFFTYGAVNWTRHGEPQRLSGVDVSQNLFPTLGVEAAVGRTFRPDEDRPGAPPVVVLRHGFWQRSFGSDPSAIAQFLTLNGMDVTIY